MNQLSTTRDHAAVQLGRVTLFVICLLFCAALSAAEPDFSKDVQPVFRKYCNGCHNAKEKEGGLILEDFAHALKGGDSGAAIVAGDSATSELWKRVTAKDDTRMPPEGHTAPKDKELALLKAWIDAGAKAPAGGLAATGLVTPQIEPQGKVREPITALAADPQGRFLAVARPNVVEIHTLPKLAASATKQDELHKLTGHTGAIADVQFSRDGKTLVVAAGETGLSGEATLWNTADWSRMQTITGHRDALYAATLSPDGALLATASYDRDIRLWNVKNQTSAEAGLLAGHNDAVYGVAFHPEGKLLASASGDRTVKLWDLATKQRLDTFAQPSKEQYSGAVSPNGKFVVSGGVDMRVRVWEITENGKEGTNPLLYARFAHEGPILKVAFSPDGRLLVSASEDRRIKIWETRTFTQVAILERQADWPAAIAFAADNRTLFVGRMNGDLAQYPVNPKWADSSSDLESLADTPEVGGPGIEVALAMETEREPNDVIPHAQPLKLPAQVNGAFHPAPSPPSAGERVRVRGSDLPTSTPVAHAPGSPDADLYRIDAKKGQVLILETNAARMKSPADTKIEVLHADGRPVQRGLLQAVRDSWINFRPIDSSQTLARVEFWEEMDLDQLMYMNGEVGKLYRAPRGPDSGYDFYDNAGKRRTYFDTTAVAHAKDESVYIVEAYPPDAKIVDNGLPLFPLYFVNDDDGERELGTDSRLTFTAPADGAYLVRVTDSRGFAGEKHTYQLTIRPPQPDFKVKVDTMNVKVPAGSGQRLKFSVDRIDNYNGAIRIDVANLPPGYHVASPTVIEAGHLTTFSVLTATADAEPAAKEAWDNVTITATGLLAPPAKGGTGGVEPARDVPSDATPPNPPLVRGGEEKIVGSLGQIVLEKPAKIHVVLLPDDLSTTAADGGLVLTPGTTITANIRVERNGFDGDVKFDVDNLPHGVIVDNIGLSGVLVRANETERQIFLTARPWVPETTRWIHAVSQVQGNQASAAIPLHIKKAASVAAK